MRTGVAVWAVSAIGLAAFAADHAPVTSGPSGQTALQWIKYGNERHMAGKYVHWHQSVERRKEVAVAGQRPHTIIVSCSDSHVPPEILFDQGLGDLYVVRGAGNIVGERELASIEYAAEHLGAPLIVVLGHQRCGAVAAAVKGGDMPGHLGLLMSGLAPAVARAKGMQGDRTELAAHENVRLGVETIRASEPLLSHLVSSGKVHVAGAYYSLDSGEVRWLAPEATRSEASSVLSH